MSDFENPYQSPAAGTEEIKSLTAHGTLTETMVKYLSDASPWLRFIGIMGFITSGMYALGGIITLITIPIAGSLEIFEEASVYISYFSQSFGWVMVFYSLIFIVAGVLTFFPALFTYRFGAMIRRYTRTNSEQELEQAFKNNKFLWKFNGILLIIALAAIPVFFVLIIFIFIAVMAIG